MARIWREEGLKVPEKHPKRRRLWLADGSCVRLRADHANHVWIYDFVTAYDVLEQSAELFIMRGTPDFIRSDIGLGFVADVVWEWLGRLGVDTLFIEPGSPWENGCIESFNGKLRYALLNGEIFDTVLEARVIT